MYQVGWEKTSEADLVGSDKNEASGGLLPGTQLRGSRCLGPAAFIKADNRVRDV